MITLQAILTGTGDTVTAAYRDASAQMDALNADGQNVTGHTTAPPYKNTLTDEWAITITATVEIPEQ